MEYPSLGTPTAGSIRFNTDSKKMELYNGEQWWEIDSTSPRAETGGTRGLWGGGFQPTVVDTIDYINVDSMGDAADFGNLTVSRSHMNDSVSSRVRGVFGPGYLPSSPNTTNVLDYVTIASTGDAIDFGDATFAGYTQGAAGSSTRGIWVGGCPGPLHMNNIQYITIASTGNAVDFGDLTEVVSATSAVSSPTRLVRGGGWGASPAPIRSTTDYITISTLGNAADYGDLTAGRAAMASGSNATRGLFGGGYSPTGYDVIDYITIASIGDALDFGNLSTVRHRVQAVTSPTRCVFGGGQNPTTVNTMEYVQIMHTGNAVDYGDLTRAHQYASGLSNGHGGLG